MPSTQPHSLDRSAYAFVRPLELLQRSMMLFFPFSVSEPTPLSHLYLHFCVNWRVPQIQLNVLDDRTLVRPIPPCVGASTLENFFLKFSVFPFHLLNLDSSKWEGNIDNVIVQSWFSSLCQYCWKKIFFKFISFLRERERETNHEGRSGRKRGRHRM